MTPSIGLNGRVAVVGDGELRLFTLTAAVCGMELAMTASWASAVPGCTADVGLGLSAGSWRSPAGGPSRHVRPRPGSAAARNHRPETST